MQFATAQVPKSTFYRLLVQYVDVDTSLAEENKAMMKRERSQNHKSKLGFMDFLMMTTGRRKQNHSIKLPSAEQDAAPVAPPPPIYVSKLVVAMTWFHWLGRYSSVLIGWHMQDVWVLPAEVMTERFKLAFTMVLGDVTHTWDVTHDRALQMVKVRQAPSSMALVTVKVGSRLVADQKVLFSGLVLRSGFPESSAQNQKQKSSPR